MSDKTCAHCNEVLGSHYYQDVPKQGDLCLKCHVVWLEETKQDLREQEWKEPTGGEMPEFRVIRRMVYSQVAVVRARTAKEAVEIVDRGGGDWDEADHDYDMPTNAWDVEDDKGNLIVWGDDG